jgi:NAD(P)-dependent dehydrogenase (short-subunit alcohol dehydrogenase family)
LILNVVRPEAASAHVAVRAARAGLLGLTGALQDEWRPYGIQVEALEEADAAAAAETALRRCAEVLQKWR